MTNEEKIYDLKAQNVPIKVYNEKGDERIFCPKSGISAELIMWFYRHCQSTEKTYVTEFDNCPYTNDYERCKHYNPDIAKQICQYWRFKNKEKEE